MDTEVIKGKTQEEKKQEIAGWAWAPYTDAQFQVIEHSAAREQALLAADVEFANHGDVFLIARAPLTTRDGTATAAMHTIHEFGIKYHAFKSWIRCREIDRVLAARLPAQSTKVEKVKAPVLVKAPDVPKSDDLDVAALFSRWTWTWSKEIGQHVASYDEEIVKCCVQHYFKYLVMEVDGVVKVICSAVPGNCLIECDATGVTWVVDNMSHWKVALHTPTLVMKDTDVRIGALVMRPLDERDVTKLSLFYKNTKAQKALHERGMREAAARAKDAPVASASPSVAASTVLERSNFNALVQAQLAANPDQTDFYFKRMGDAVQDAAFTAAVDATGGWTRDGVEYGMARVLFGVHHLSVRNSCTTSNMMMMMVAMFTLMFSGAFFGSLLLIGCVMSLFGKAPDDMASMTIFVLGLGLANLMTYLAIAVRLERRAKTLVFDKSS